MGSGMDRKGESWRVRRSLVLVIIASILERADVAVIPAVYREIGLAMHFSPTSIGIFRLVQMITQAIGSPLAGYLALRFNRAKVIAGGAFVAAIATFSIGISTTFPQIAFSIALNTFGVVVTWPAIQSLIADATDDTNRGKIFGLLQLTSHIGALFGSSTAVLLAGTSVLGVSGWRVAFFLMAALSLVIAISLHLFAHDPFPNRGLGSPATVSVGSGGPECKPKCLQVKGTKQYVKEMLEDVRLVLGVRTFQVIVVQGMVVSIAWSALSFSTMWLELIGFSHPQTATIMGSFIVAGSLGGLFGGLMGDRWSRSLPDSGRIMLAQFSNGIAVPFTTILLLWLPADPSRPYLHGLVIFLMGCCISWTAPAANYPIMAEIVPTKSRTNIYALEKGFVSILGAFSPPLVGIISEKMFGYVPASKGADGKVIVSMDRQNGAALGKAMYVLVGIPFLLCCLVFTPLYWSYPKDRDHVRKQLEGSDQALEYVDATEKGQFLMNSKGMDAEGENDEDSRGLLDESRRSL